MDINPLDPDQASTLVNIPQLVQEINVPGIGDGDGTWTCFTNGNGSNKCFNFKGKNDVSCVDKKCFVSYETLDQNVIGNAKRINRIGLNALMIPNGLSTRVMLVGEIERKRLRTLKKIIGDFNVKETDILPVMHDGLPEPGRKCHLNPFSKGCSMYLTSDDWSWYPGIGIKKRIDVIRNPRVLLKNDVIPQLKKMGKSIGKKIAAMMPWKRIDIDKTSGQGRDGSGDAGKDARETIGAT